MEDIVIQMFECAFSYVLNVLCKLDNHILPHPNKVKSIFNQSQKQKHEKITKIIKENQIFSIPIHEILKQIALVLFFIQLKN